MPLIPKYALARSYALTANLTATVTDNGGAGRSVTIASSGAYVRAFLAASGGGGTSTSDPYELFARAGTQLSAGSGGGTWAVSWHTNATTGVRDGRVRLAWTGTGNGTVSAGGLLAALGFTASTGAIASGSYAVSAYPPIGVLLWALTSNDGDWTASQASAQFEDAAGKSSRVAASSIQYRRSMVAHWLPRAWSTNDSNEYLSPIYASESAYAGPSSVSAPDPAATAAPWSWLEGIFAVDGSVEHGFTDEFGSVTTSSKTRAAYIAPSTFEQALSLASEKEPRYRQRKDLQLELTSTGAITL